MRLMMRMVVMSSALLAGVAQAAPVVLRQSVEITATTFHGDDWIPLLAFAISGDAPGGLTATFTRPDGTVWGNADVRIDDGDDRHVHTITNATLDPDHLSEKITGVVKLAIMSGKDTLFTAAFKVDALPGGKFAIDQDWRLGVDQLFVNERGHDDNPGLVAAAWFKGGDCNDVDAAIAFGGKVIATTEDRDQADKGQFETLRSTGDVDAARYSQCRFDFNLVKAYVNGDYGPQPTWHELPKHPGKYELRLSRNKQPVRAVAFTVDKTGMLARTGLVEPARRGYRMMLPAKGELFYGNPPDKATDVGVAAMYASWKRKK